MLFHCDFFLLVFDTFLLLLNFPITQKYIQLLLYSYLAPMYSFTFQTTSSPKTAHRNFSICLSMSLQLLWILFVLNTFIFCHLTLAGKFTCLIQPRKFLLLSSVKKTTKQTGYSIRWFRASILPAHFFQFTYCHLKQLSF